ncbi:MAG: hypothetical protein ACTSO9_21585 [Candidatus Helarchaeota archaeon]
MDKIFLKLVSTALFILLIFADAVSQDTDFDSLATDMKIDLINNLQKKAFMVLRNEPLRGKSFGIEINPFRPLIWNKRKSFSGGFSLFDVDRNGEFIFSLFYSKPQREYSMSTFTFDFHYRRFIGNSQDGTYLSLFVLYAYLEGVRIKPYSYYTESDLNDRTHANKLGIGIGFGYRKFSHVGIYWGVGFCLGWYVFGKSDIFRHEGIFDDPSDFIDNDMSLIIGLELLKIGWAF